MLANGSRVLKLIFALSGTAVWLAGQGTLPAPTGSFAVGRVTVDWQDTTRIEPFSPTSESRELMVDFWYPAEASAGAAAPYLDLDGFEKALGTEGLRNFLTPAYAAVRAGVRTHAVSSAPFTRAVQRSPILIFSPGGGMIREVYAAQLEDLASHGYVVAAISHPYDAIAALYPGGGFIKYDSKRWPTPPSFEGESNLNQLEWHTCDIRFVLDQLGRAAEIHALPFAGRLDLSRVGAFGHSFGGIAAAHACQEDPRIKACLNQDGEAGMRPYYLDAHGWGMDQAFMFIERDPRTEPPSDAELTNMKVKRERVNEILARLRAYQDRVFRSAGGGTIHVLLNRSATTHIDFSDLPVLGARDHGEAESRAQVLSIVRDYTRGFFDRYVKGIKAPLLDSNKRDPLVINVWKFAPARK